MNKRMPFKEAAEAVKLRIDVVDIVGRYVALKKAGRNYSGLCPFHKEKTPSFSVSHEKQLFKCFGCGEGGDALSFLMKHEHKTYGEVIRDLAADMGIDIVEDGRKNQAHKAETDVFFQLHQDAQAFYAQQLEQSEAIQGYLTNRGIPMEWAKKFGIGFAPPGWDNLTKHLTQHHEPLQKAPHLLEKAGLASLRQSGEGVYDRFRNRLIIPIHDERARIVAFGGRCVDPEDNPKYLNSPETTIYNKSRILYGYAMAKPAIRETQAAIVMEGYFDVISAHMAGIPNAIGVCGTALTEYHLKLLQRAGAETIYLCFDSDAAGQKAALRAIELVENHLLEEQIRLKVIELTDGKDPDDFLKAHGLAGFETAITNATDFLTFKFDRVLAQVDNTNSPEGRIKATKLITPLLLQIQQPVIRHEYTKRLAERLCINEETLLLELKRWETKNQPYSNKKNYNSGAIFDSAQRYIGKQSKSGGSKRRSFDDIPSFRKSLSKKLPVEEKEHLLLSFLLADNESYDVTMSMCSQREFKSPLAQELLNAVAAFQGQWDSTTELVHLLRNQFSSQEHPALLQFLTDRVMEQENVLESYGLTQGGLKSIDYRGKLEKVTQGIFSTIEHHEQQALLASLAEEGKHCEQTSDESSVLEVQRQLRDKLKARQQQTHHTEVLGEERSTLAESSLDKKESSL